MVPENEHRENTRHPHEASILIENLPGGTYYHGKMINYSNRGMYFESNIAHQPGTTIIFGIENSPYDTCPGVYRAEVKWCKKLPHEASMYYFGVGVEYDRPDRAKAPKYQPPLAEPVAPQPSDESAQPHAALNSTQTHPAAPAALVAEDAKRDLRRHPRKAYAKMVLYASDQRFYEGNIKDISRSGVFIETHEGLYVGQTLTLSIPTPKRQKGLKLKGEIVRIEPNGLGIKFKRIVEN
jgi:hypothetical protein